MRSRAPAPRPQRRRAEGARVLDAILRLRARALAPRWREGVILLPALLHARFPHPGFQDEAPGVAGARFRPSWTRAARRFELAPPGSVQRAPPVVQAILATAWKGRLEILVLAEPSHPADRQRLERRCVAASAVLDAGEVPNSIAVAAPSVLAVPDEAVLRALLFGTLVAGSLPASSFPGPSLAIPGDVVAPLAADAPSGLAALQLMLLCGGAPLHPVRAIAQALSAGVRLPLLADPELACREWAVACGAHAELLDVALSVMAGDERVRALSEVRLRETSARYQREPRGDTGAVLRAGRTLAVGCAFGVRRVHGPMRAALRRRMREDLLEAGLPAAMLPALGARIASEARLRPLPESWCLISRRNGKVHEVHSPSGAILGQASTIEGARVRALALMSRALGRAVQFPPGEEHWHRLSERLARRGSGAIAIVDVDEGPGPPFDPLCRGPGRRLTLRDVLWVDTRSGFRPCAFRVSGRQAVERCLRYAAEGSSVLPIALRPEAATVASRLSRLMMAVRGRGPDVPPLAVQVSNDVMLVDGTRLRRFALRRFVSRPRRAEPDREAPDLTLALAGGGTPVIRAAGPLHQCLVSSAGNGTMAVLFADGERRILREEVQLEELLAYLHESVRVLRDAPWPSLLGTQLNPDVEELVRHGLPAVPAVRVSLHGSLPRTLELRIDGERFGDRAPLPWSAAAEVVLAQWPPGVRGRLDFEAIEVDVGPSPASGLMLLHARSVARRRVLAHLRRLDRA